MNSNMYTYTSMHVIVKAAYSETMDIFRKKKFPFKSFVKVELSFGFYNKNVQYS